ncbi:hypothetical protein I4U23_008035 [Adineta vaga]|nr:hypothetical protein I4U23_008035 [Adineta vaga]
MILLSLWSSIIGLILCLSSLIIIVTFYLHKKIKRDNIWQTTTDLQSVICSEPISRRSSSTYLANLEKHPTSFSSSSRFRSASFSEDLSARLQILTSNTHYHSYSPTVVSSLTRAYRPSLAANVRLPITSNSSSNIPSTKSPVSSITFQLGYDHTTETLFITIFQLHNFLPIKSTQPISIIVYLLPNEDEQRQTQLSSSNGIFNEYFQFHLQSNDLCNRTLRLTIYTVDSTTRIRNILGHVFIKLDRFAKEMTDDKTFCTDILSENLTSELQIRSDYLGELVLTHTYLKDQNLIQIRLQQLNHLHIDQTTTKIPLKAYFSGQTSTSCPKYNWTNTTSFFITSLSAVHLNQELNLSIHSVKEHQIKCHLRLHLHGHKSIHSHARWEQLLRSNVPTTITVPLVAL